MLGVWFAGDGMAGFVGGLLGVGGGNIIVPALVACGLDPKQATATTSFVVIASSLTEFQGQGALAGVVFAQFLPT